MNGVFDYRWNGDGMQAHDLSPRGFYKHRSVDKHFSSSSSFISTCASRRSHSPDADFLSKVASGRNSMDAATFPSFSKSKSRWSSGTIMFSNSMGLLKPPPIEKELECTLEELCFGCIKRIKITRDVLTNTGEMVQEDELLTIKVKPGWTNGTKITFEGMGNERPGALPADMTFFIAEKWHPLFRREGDTLESAIEIPLVKALTGLTLSFPLLGGERMNLRIDDIIFPGYEKIIAGQGMPNPKEQGKRGDLRIKFLVEFPTELTGGQRSDVLRILQDSC